MLEISLFSQFRRIWVHIGHLNDLRNVNSNPYCLRLAQAWIQLSLLGVVSLLSVGGQSRAVKPCNWRWSDQHFTKWPTLYPNTAIRPRSANLSGTAPTRVLWRRARVLPPPERFKDTEEANGTVATTPGEGFSKRWYQWQRARPRNPLASFPLP